MSRHSTFDPSRFRRLLDRWNAHQDLRRESAAVADLARSRTKLDAARADLRRATPTLPQLR